MQGEFSFLTDEQKSLIQNAKPFAKVALRFAYLFEHIGTKLSKEEFTQALQALSSTVQTNADDLATIKQRLQVDDLDLDTLQELVTYAKVNKDHLDSLVLSWDKIEGKPTVFPPSIHAHDNATTIADGAMSKADKSKLDGIEASANKYVLPVASSTVLGGVKASISGTTLTITTS